MQLQHGVFRLNPILLSLGLLAIPGLAQAESVKANETMVVTATQTKHTELSAPASVSVVTRADLDKMNVNNIGDALKHVPGVNIVAFFLVNGYLLGREFFEFAAMRIRSPDEARLYRSRHSGTVFAAGLVIAAFLAIPILNLLTPLFAAGLMVHLHKMLSARDGVRPV